MGNHRQYLLDIANRALAGQVADINIRRDGSLALLNAGKELLWTGYSPDAEYLKGLIVRVSGNRATDLVAGCLPKFYNDGESSQNDAAFRAALTAPDAQAHFLEKADGCLKFDSLIRMADGSTRRIIDICVGDEVLGMATDRSPATSVVTGLLRKSGSGQWLSVRTSRRTNSGNSYHGIVCTPEHRFFDPVSGLYQTAAELRPGNKVLTFLPDEAQHGSFITSVEEVVHVKSPDRSRASELYDLETTTHNYVAGDVVVHNSNLRPYFHPDRSRVEFATRGMLQVSSGAGVYTDFAALAHEVARDKYPALLRPELVRRYTVITELIHPANRIVTDYGSRRDLVVLAVIELASGRELRRAELDDFCREQRLSLVPAYSPRAVEYLAAVAELRGHWQNTDLEGMVVSVERSDADVPYRLKVKAERYLRLMRLKNACTLRRTREMVEQHQLPDWVALRRHLLAEFPELPEEVQLGYRQHFERWAAWQSRLSTRLADVETRYNALPVLDADQKTFALAIANEPDRAAFFALRKDAGPDGRARVMEMLRKAHRAELGEELEPDQSLAG